MPAASATTTSTLETVLMTTSIRSWPGSSTCTRAGASRYPSGRHRGSSRGGPTAGHGRQHVAGLADDPDVDRRVVHVVLDALAVDQPDPDDVALGRLQARRQIDTPADRVTTEIERVGVVVVPDNLAEHAGRLEMA